MSNTVKSTHIFFRHEMVALGFDSGEVQFYTNFGPDDEAEGDLKKFEIGPGFRVSNSDPVRFVRSLEEFSPFYQGSVLNNYVSGIIYMSLIHMYLFINIT